MLTIVVCAVLQNAASRILEWMAFHRLIGADRFVLYDLGSTDGTAALIARSRFGHQATVIDWARKGGRDAAHADFLANQASRFTWAAILEQDEFIHLLVANSIRSVLPRFDGFSAVVLRRLTFVTSDHPIRPGQLVIANCTNRVPDDSPLNVAAPTLLRTADLRLVAGTQDDFDLAGDLCDARGEGVSAEAPPAQAFDELMVVNRYPMQWASHVAPAAATSIMVANPFEAPPPGADTEQPPRPAEALETLPDRRILRFVPRLRAMLHDASLAAQPRPALSTAAAPASAAAAPASTSTPSPPAPAAPHVSPSLLLGIGIVTYNRRPILGETLDRVQQHTRHPRTIVAVADDGSTDGTLDMLRERQVLTVTGRNMSIAWNKNRALFLLSALVRCDVVLLLEDDAYPTRDNWEIEWMHAAIRWGHANVAGPWLREHFIAGAGTVDDPIYSSGITAQCAVFSREALLFGGYFDSRFRRYGHEHVEHSRRLLRLGYGGTEEPVNGHPGPLFKLIWGGIELHQVPSVVVAKEVQAEQNMLIAQQLFSDVSYRAPWQDETEARQLRDEMHHTFPRSVL
jgi:hypothetical protein